MASKNNPKGRENEVVVQDLKGELLIYDLTIKKAYCLNPTSAAIWNLCDGNNSVPDITLALSKKLKQPVTDDVIWLALDQFKEDNLLADSETVEIKFDGLSRREVIRKVGFASMIALPVIASLVAPTAAMAQSSAGFAAGSRTLGQSCTATTQCASSAPVCTVDEPRKCCVSDGNGPSGSTYGSSVGVTCASGSNCRTFARIACCSGSSTQISCTNNAGGSNATCRCT